MTYTYRHALSDATVYGIEMPGANHLELIDGVTIHSVLAFKGRHVDVEAALKADAELSVRFVGPGEWLVVNEASRKLEIEAAMVVDQSHGRSLFRLSGPQASKLLLKGVGIDLLGDSFPVGASANTAFGHVTINLARLAGDLYELIVMRSFAESLFHDLKLAGREFSLSFAVREG